MKILILTPINPLQITEVAMHLMPRYQSSTCEVFSPQAMALLYEETFKQPYPVVNAFFTNAAKDKKFYNIKNKKHLIVFGNIDITSRVKFDRIIAFTSSFSPSREDTWDPYLEHSLRSLDGSGAPTVQYYSIGDAEYTFPTLPHLDLFLKTLGIEQVEQVVTETEGENRGTIQPSATEGN